MSKEDSGSNSCHLTVAKQPSLLSNADANHHIMVQLGRGLRPVFGVPGAGPPVPPTPAARTSMDRSTPPARMNFGNKQFRVLLMSFVTNKSKQSTTFIAFVGHLWRVAIVLLNRIGIAECTSEEEQHC